MLSPSLNPTAPCFALLDDRDADDLSPRSRLYTGYQRTLACHDASTLPRMLQEMQNALAQGMHAIVLLAYELGADMQGIAVSTDAMTVSQVLLFQDCTYLSEAQVGAWLATQSRTQSLAQSATPQPAGVVHVRANVSQAEFTDAIERVRAYIEAGDTYQVNYTYRLRFSAYGSVFDLYRKLRKRQPVPYGALIGLPDGRSVLSLSPELFVRHDAGELTARPMKGTAAASADTQQNAGIASALAADSKNRAENLMIVDLLRNDLGRVAEVGTVQVPKLFEVTRFSSVLQMTSTVRARLRDDAELNEIFSALYPCGSITGAPKRRTMQIINELERDPRGYYTGAIGWFDPPNASSTHAIGDFCLSVPIRTLILQAPSEDGLRLGEMGVGAGIVYDSKPDEEFAECQLKARFLTGLRHDFELFETMYATREAGCRHLERHLARLQSSADFFAFAFDEIKIKSLLLDVCVNLPAGVPHRMRLALDASGNCTLQHAPLAALVEPVKLLLALRPVAVDPLFLRHKTTVRSDYDHAWRVAESQGAFDMLFCNDHGEVTEGARSNLFVKLGGHWFTPPLTAGVLPGVMRAVLLEDAQWDATERSISLDDLRAADEIVVCNALRGAMRAHVVWPAKT
jgi:para-aminobenzoate synthetase/4-amino-4-deoxychorismate lyase